MQRLLSDLTDRTFDLLVVGGGICGLTIACDAAERGLSVALIERDDFGSGASFNHLRTIHGGLRYLQHLDLARARESVAERRTLAVIAPWAVQPIPFVLPLGGSLMKRPLAMRAGFLLDRVIARQRNLDVPERHRLPAGTVLSTRDAAARFPLLRDVPMTGVAVWYDYVTTESDRLTLAWATAAADRGAALANYVEATTLLTAGGRVAGVTARDALGGGGLEVRARVIVNATGGSLDRLLSPQTLSTGVPMTKAMNLVTSITPPAVALGGRSRSGRNLFLVPWRGRALFGTWESGSVHEADDMSIRTADVSSFIADINHAFPSLGLTHDQVTLVQRGLVPAVMRPGHAPEPDGHEQIHDHASAGHPELISVAATKYTTARAVAEKVTTGVLTVLGRSAACRTARTPLSDVGLTGDALLQHAARHEMVMTLSDAVVRRTPLGALGRPAGEALAHAATVVGSVLGWDDARQREEIAAVHRFYDRLDPVN